MTQYLCWNCGLMQGDESDPMGVSTLCPSCRAAGVTGRSFRDDAEREAEAREAEWPDSGSGL